MLAPGIRAEYDLTLPQVGLMLTSVSVGGLVTVFLWGLAADRFGERLTIVTGLGAAGLCVAAIAYAPGFEVLLLLVAVAGATGWSVNSASARAVMQWFHPDERGYALGLRQTALPVGGLAAALGLPAIEATAGLDGALISLGALCIAAAVVGGVLVRENHVEEVIDHDAPPWTVRDPRLWRLGFASALYVFTQVAMIGFVVLFLHDVRGFSTRAAAMVLAGIYLVGAILRIGSGRWSDRRGVRVVPLRHFGLATFVTMAVVAVLVGAPKIVLVPMLVAAGGISMAWNGLSVTAAAELGGRRRSGAAIGVQQTFLAVSTVVGPVVFAATVDATSWRVAFTLAAVVALAGWWLLAPLSERRRVAA